MEMAINKLAMNAVGQVGGQLGGAVDSTSRHAELEKVAGALVAQTFFGALLKQMRESPFKDEIFSGGRGGQAFGSMYDQHLAEHMARGAGQNLVRAIVRKFEGKQAYDRQAKSRNVPLSQKGDIPAYSHGDGGSEGR